jgi:hypothetical protein
MIPEQLRRVGFRFIKLSWTVDNKGSRGKIPLEKDWQNTKNYSFDDPELQEWLDAGNNVGVATGYNMLFVPDIDSPEEYERIKNLLPETFTVKSGGRGLPHYYYFLRDVDEVPNRKVGKVDLRGLGGQVVGAGSILKNEAGEKIGEYTVLKDAPIASVSWNKIKEVFNITDERERVNIKETMGGVQEGTRNESLFKMACSLVHQDFDKSDILAMLDTANNKTTPKLSAVELLRIRDSAWRYHKPRQQKRVEETPIAEIATNTPTKLPIELPKTGKLISSFINDITQILADSKVLFFRPDEKAVVKIEEIPSGDEDKKVLGFKAVSPPDFVTELERYIVPFVYVYDSRNDISKMKPKSLNCEIAKIILASDKLSESLPIILTLYDVPMPVLTNGVLRVPKVGYDPELKSWLNPHSPTLRQDMTLEEAKSIMEEIVGEFCFESPQDKVNAISAILTPFLRGLYSRKTCRTPIMFWKANRERAGKDYGAGITGIIYYGESIDDTPIVCDNKVNDEEFRKKILSIFKMGRNRYHSANNKGYLNSAQLENLATTENFTDRTLGANVTLTFPNTLELSLSANTGITYTPDIAKRCLFIKLFLEVEDPNTRLFKKDDLHGWIRSMRSDIISALYAFVRTWYEAGMPKGDTPFASFPAWASVCGGIMKVCDLGDPCAPNQELVEIGGDAETADMKALFEYFHALWGEKAHNKRDIMDLLASGVDELEGIFAEYDWSFKGTKNKFSMMFEKYKGREFSGIRLIKVLGSQRGRHLWKFVKRTSLDFHNPTDTPDTPDTPQYPYNKNSSIHIHPIIYERLQGVSSVSGVSDVAISESGKAQERAERELSLSFEDLQNILLDKINYEEEIDKILKLGFLENDLDQWLGEGLLLRVRGSCIKLI